MTKSLSDIKTKISKGWVHPTVKRVMEHNKKLKEERKKDSLRNVEAYVDEVADHHFRFIKSGAIIKIGGYGPGVKKYCYICGEHDFEMVSGIGKNDGAYYCTKHKSIRGLALQEQEIIRSEHNVKK